VDQATLRSCGLVRGGEGTCSNILVRTCSTDNDPTILEMLLPLRMHCQFLLHLGGGEGMCCSSPGLVLLLCLLAINHSAILIHDFKGKWQATQVDDDITGHLATIDCSIQTPLTARILLQECMPTTSGPESDCLTA
jgi:hypothetical protein